MRITTDHKWKNFCYRYEVPVKVLTEQFDYQDENEALDGFFCYRGTWYHLDEFLRDGAPQGWHGFAADSFFSGVVIELSRDGEQYRVGTLIA